MDSQPPSGAELRARIEQLEATIRDQDDALSAIRGGEVDAIIPTIGDGLYRLQTADEPYRIMVEEMREGAMTVAHAGHISFVNQAMASLLGHTPDQLLGREVRPFFAGDAWSRLQRSARRDGRRREHCELKVGPRRIECEVTAQVLSAGAESQLLLLVHDLTESRAYEELMRSDEIARELLDHAADAIYVLDASGHIVAQSSQCERWAVGDQNPSTLADFYRVGLMPNHAPNSVPLGLDAPTHFVPLADAIAAQPLWHREAVVELPQGERPYVLLSHSLVRRHSKLRGSILTIADITERRRMELALARRNTEHRVLTERVTLLNDELSTALAAAEAANRMKSAFLANVSHEIRTPMSPIMGCISLLERDPSLSDRQRGFTEMMRRGANQLLAVVDDLIELSRIESGELQVGAVPVNLTDLLSEAGADHATSARNKGLWLKVTLPEAPLWVRGDKGRIRQIVDNLLGNATKFTLEGGIEVGLRLQESDEVALFVRDTGIGIEATHAEQVFERFFQEQRVPETGSGLGLNICEKLAAAMNATISVVSQLNQGSTFSVTFPLCATGVEVDDDPRDSTYDNGGMAPLDGKVVLLAEDDSISAQLVEHMLHSVGVTLHHVKDGAAALRSYHELHPDLLLLDVNMPQMSGEEVLIEIRKTDPQTPIVVQTAYAMPEDAQRFIDEGAQACLVKPVEVDSLVACLRLHLAPTD